jgi:Na+/glutamate symporter
MDLGTVAAFEWPDAVAVFGIVLGITVLIGGAMATFVELRKAKVAAGQQDDLRQLVRRYEHFAENALDTQQRLTADVAELRSRTASIEKILRTVDGE